MGRSLRLEIKQVFSLVYHLHFIFTERGERWTSHGIERSLFLGIAGGGGELIGVFLNLLERMCM